MAEELFIPKLGQTVEEVTLMDWLAEDGAKVDFGQPILEVETDKAVFPVEANAKGYLHRGPYKKGDLLPVLTVVAIIGKQSDSFGPTGEAPAAPAEEAAPFPQFAATGPAPAQPAGDGGRKFISPRARKLAIEKQMSEADVSAISPTGGGGVRIAERDVVAFLNQIPKVTPVAQNMAAQAGLDLSNITGTGPRGAITKADVEQALKEKTPEPAVAPAPATTPPAAPRPAPVTPLPEVDVTNQVPLKGVRRIIFERMGASVHTTARVTLVTEVDATSFVEAREVLKANVTEVWGFAPGYNDLLGLIVARALREFSFMNARLSADGTEIEWLSHINLGMAVDTERGLVVPVIKDADTKGLRLFGSEFRQMVDRARAGKSLPDDLSGGTFTITNLGMYDIDAFTPVINLPEVAILGVGRIAPKVVPYNGQPAIRQMLSLSLVFDHRLVDGAPAARFLQRIKQMVENPYLLLG